jgi:membrane protease YdiL (CAAX protease family)
MGVAAVRAIRATGLTLLLFVAVYLPASAIARALHLQLAATVPFVMFFTFVTACLFIRGLASRRHEEVAQYGINVPAVRHVVSAVIVSGPISIVTALLLSRVHESGPLAGLSLAPWLVVLYFVVGAPVQEELIFRGLLQTTLATRIALPTESSRMYGVVASLLVALLFGGIHLVVGPYTAAAAFILGAIAGEFRRASGSLVPAIVCHSFFNLGAIIWT